MKRKLLALTLTIPLLLVVPTFAGTNTQSKLVNPQTITLNGVVIKDTTPRINSDAALLKSDNGSKGNISVMANSFISYSSYIPNSVTARFTDYNNYHKLFWNSSVTLPAGVSYTYEWYQTVSNTDTRTHAVDAGARAQGGNKFLAEIEGHINYNYQKQSEIKIEAGQKSSIGFLQPGSYNMNWYMKAKKYDLNTKWYGYTVDAPSTQKVLDRYSGSVVEPTPYLNVDIKKTR